MLSAALLFLKLRAPAAPRGGKKQADAALPDATGTHFHAVSIRPGRGACTSARELEGQRFLSREAPALPLPECGQANCDCRFAHHADRRSNDPRRSLYNSRIGLDIGASGKEKRKGQDRRGN